jgi:5-methyltetrahydrofolate--homocysteine methyltransferase
VVALTQLLPTGTLLDGGVGTQLLARGLDLAVEPPEIWNLSRPEQVLDVHSRYRQAGATALQTNSFGGNRRRLAGYGLADQVFDLNAAAARLARQAAGPKLAVIGSIGPSGTTPPPEGDASLGELEEMFAEQAAALAHGGVDALHVETMYHPKEARAALRGCRLGAPALPVIASLTCRMEGAHYATGLGYGPEPIVQAFVEEGAAGLGVNCTLTPADMLDLVRLLRRRTTGPILAKPTIAPQNGAPLLPGEFATGALALLAAGATAVGGCCGSGPADIAAARAAIDADLAA